MAKKKLMNPSHVLIFVEGDTDEVFFKALVGYYASVSSNKLLPYDVCNLKGVTCATGRSIRRSHGIIHTTCESRL